jgi:DNA polymerase-3 subunit gamma/tau
METTPIHSQRNLSLELRPKRFSEMVGQDQLVTTLTNQLATGRVPAAIMLIGPPGCGKTTTARILARSLNCPHGPVGEPCDTCLENDNFEIIERNAADMTGIDDTRGLQEHLVYQPRDGDYRVIILDECQQLSKSAQNLLLKVLEPEKGSPQFNIFIFCTTDPAKIEKTLRDRCLVFHVSGLGRDDVARLVLATLTGAGITGSLDEYQPLVRLLLEREVTSPRNIVMAVEKVLAGLPIEQAAVADESGDVNMGALCGAVIRGDWEASRALLASAKPNDGATIRVVLTGFFRKKLLELPSSRFDAADKLSEFILEMTDHNSPEVGIQLSAVVASIFRICQMARAATVKKAA